MMNVRPSPPAAAPSPPKQPARGEGGRGKNRVPLPPLPSLTGGEWRTVDWDGWRANDWHPWPAWVKGFREHQLDAVEEIIDAYQRGTDVVFLDAPTGAGKTLIGEMVRRLIGGRALYVCHSLGLQDQFAHDFDYAQVLKGRANYPTQLADFPEVTCADCTLTTRPDDEAADCQWCVEPVMCSYIEARETAAVSPLTVVNTSYLLAEANTAGRISSGADLVIADEADTLEQIVMGAVEFRVGPAMLRRAGVEPPKKGSHSSTLAKWLKGELKAGLLARRKSVVGDKVEQIRERVKLTRVIDSIDKVADEILTDAWVRDYDNIGSFILKAVKVDGVAEDHLWRHGRKWLCMSATLISTAEMVDSLGLEDAGLKVETVTVPMTFPVENRPIHALPVTAMTAKNKEAAWPRMAEAIGQVLGRHEGEKVLVHTVSYELAKYLIEHVDDPHQRQTYTYTTAGTRELAVRQYKANDDAEGAVMYAPSLDRGFDFAGDDARVVIVAKLPYPYLGDQQVSARLHTRGGQQWYQVSTIRSIVQMTGRGVRSAEDWAVTYVLDESFYKLWKDNRMLLPKWWREAVDTSTTLRDLGIKLGVK